jgi:hypothetical protein
MKLPEWFRYANRIGQHKEAVKEIEKYNPALKRNYDTVFFKNNTGDLFVVLDAWEALNMAQLDKLDKLNAILSK